jgi:hypothetical protein
MITLLLNLLIAAIVLGLILWIASQIPGIQPFVQIIRVVIIAIFCIYVIYVLMAVLGGGHMAALK